MGVSQTKDKALPFAVYQELIVCLGLDSMFLQHEPTAAPLPTLP